MREDGRGGGEERFQCELTFRGLKYSDGDGEDEGVAELVGEEAFLQSPVYQSRRGITTGKAMSTGEDESCHMPI